MAQAESFAGAHRSRQRTGTSRRRTPSMRNQPHTRKWQILLNLSRRSCRREVEVKAHSRASPFATACSARPIPPHDGGESGSLQLRALVRRQVCEGTTVLGEIECVEHVVGVAISIGQKRQPEHLLNESDN